MDTHQIWSLILLTVIAGTLVGLLIVVYKGLVRRDAAAEVQAKLLNRLVDIEAALKSALPAIERNTGAVDRIASETLPAIHENSRIAARSAESATTTLSKMAERLDATGKQTTEQATILKDILAENGKTTKEVASLRHDLTEAVKF